MFFEGLAQSCISPSVLHSVYEDNQRVTLLLCKRLSSKHLHCRDGEHAEETRVEGLIRGVSRTVSRRHEGFHEGFRKGFRE